MARRYIFMSVTHFYLDLLKNLGIHFKLLNLAKKSILYSGKITLSQKNCFKTKF